MSDGDGTASSDISDTSDSSPDGAVIMTARLRLRRFTASEADVELLVELDGDPEVVRFITGGAPTPRAEVVDEVLPHWLALQERLPGQGFWAAHERDGDAFVGWFHLRPGDGHGPDEPELGYRLRRSAWGRGYGSEGSQALVDHAFEQLGATQVLAETMVVNSASRRVMERVGMVPVRYFTADWPVRIAGDEWGDVEYAVTRERWERDRRDERRADQEAAAVDELAATFRQLSARSRRSESDGRNEVVALVRGQLGTARLDQPVVQRRYPPFELVNLDTALAAWSAEDGRTVEVHGFTLPPHFGLLSLQQLLHGDGLPPVRLSATELVDLPVGPGRTRACLVRAIFCVRDERGSYVVMLRGPVRHEDPSLVLEVAGLGAADAQAVHEALDGLRRRLNVYRGQLLELAMTEGGTEIRFPDLTPTAREDVVLPEATLRRVERHTLDLARHRDGLRAAGRHLKRGVLLHGPPGTGKTHTTRYVVQHLPGTTVLLLAGPALHLVSEVTALARELEPAAVVLEDVDLVAEERGHNLHGGSVLFALLDAMDGSAADADLLFLLTTNRPDLLEPALASRPGRVDAAVEIGLPDAAARRRLLDLYARGTDLGLTDDEVDAVVGRTAGVTASFVKELLRRAVLEQLLEGESGQDAADDAQAPVGQVSAAHLHAALDDLLDSAQTITRALLGVPGDQDAAPTGPALEPQPGLAPPGLPGSYGGGGFGH